MPEEEEGGDPHCVQHRNIRYQQNIREKKNTVLTSEAKLPVELHVFATPVVCSHGLRPWKTR